MLIVMLRMPPLPHYDSWRVMIDTERIDEGGVGGTFPCLCRSGPGKLQPE
jgi:hypothetical protein